ncbi:MAG: DUF2961 domain-containing protein [Armatimonadetes bacterium]|nr:DUF2961 domain-containing protein [Armatimonadota bacterium]
MWDRWAYLRIGQRAYMASTFDRTGGNRTADAGHFLYQLADDFNVTMDVMGPGVLEFARYNHWHGSPWHYVVDGNDYIVQESSTADPTKPVENSVFLPERQFPHPLTWTWSVTKGADLMWVPIPFEKSFTMAYGRTCYGTGYYIYHKFMPGMTNLSRPIKSWTINNIPPDDVLDLIRKSGSDIAPKGDSITALAGTVSLSGKQKKDIVVIRKAPSTIRALKLSIPRQYADVLARARLRIYWDANPIPSVDAPVSLLFGAGTLYNREDREYLVKAFPVSIRFTASTVDFAMYFPMPFLKSARLELEESLGMEIKGLRWTIRYEPYKDPANWVCNFHATYVDHGKPIPGKDLVLLDTTKVEGGGDWCGHFVGTSFIFSDRAVLRTLEGDPRFFFDDSNTPQAQGTGTEEWCGGGDYWGGRTMTIPFAGHPTGAPSDKEAQCEEDKIQSAYRFLLADLMPFGKNARIQLEHGGGNDSEEHYRTVTFWYGLHQPCLVQTDEFHVGDLEDEEAHEYFSPTASEVQTLSSRYEWGVDHLHGKEIFPETTDTGRYMKGISTFVLKLNPNNLGVLLRRKFDYSFPNQCARVSVADVTPGALWHEVGIWYTAGSNTVVHSIPPEGELGPTRHEVITSNRRWREEEFMLPRQFTEGRSAIRLRIQFMARNIPLFPGHPLAEQAWSEYGYKAYCFIMPKIHGL